MLLEVAETGGFSKAAQRLGIATSSVTRTMDALESSLGAALLTRTTRRVALTDAGTNRAEVVRALLKVKPGATATAPNVPWLVSVGK